MIEGKIFPNVNAAAGALNAAHATWTPPSYVDVGGGRHRLHALLPPQVLSVALELDDATWFVIADHPGFKGDFIAGPHRIKPIQASGPQNVVTEPKGAESGVVERPAAKSKRKAV